MRKKALQFCKIDPFTYVKLALRNIRKLKFFFLQHVAENPLLEDAKMDDPLEIIEILNGKIKLGLDVLSVSDKYLEAMDEVLIGKVN